MIYSPELARWSLREQLRAHRLEYRKEKPSYAHQPWTRQFHKQEGKSVRDEKAS